MKILLSEIDFARLGEDARTEILALLSPPEPDAPQLSPEFEGLDMDRVVDLTDEQVQRWMEAASDTTKSGVRVFAEQGPIVPPQALTAAGIKKIYHFQSRTTVRTRTVTGRKNAHFFGWTNDWKNVEAEQRKLAVTPITYRSLRRYFQLAAA